MNLRETDDQDSITLPADLTNTQRKFVHELSKQMGLKSKSYGKGEGRRVVISKVLSGGGMNSMMGSIDNNNSNNKKSKKKDGDEAAALPTEAEYKLVPRINVGKRGEEALKKHLSKFPPSAKEEAESRETGSSLLLKNNQDVAVVVDDDNMTGDKGDVIQEKTSLLALNDLIVPSQDDTSNYKPSAISMYNDWHQKQKAKHERMIQQRVQNYKQSQQQTKSHQKYQQMMKQRRNLPAFAYAQDICNILRIKRNQVVILTGDTGCGKSTQVPQFILDDPQIGPTCNILITQPRRISAISVAERVASERCEPAGQSVGYSVRLEGSSSKKTQLLFCTPGVLMKRLHPVDGGPMKVDGCDNFNRLAGYTHIIMDEIHERDKNTEFLMIALQELLDEREDLQLILMSATMPTRDLAEYWCGVGQRRLQQQKEKQEKEQQSMYESSGDNGENKDGQMTAPYSKSLDDDDWGDDGAAMPVEINIPGRTFPVQEFFLEDVLSMTGFVNEAGGDATDMAQMESDLLALMGGPPPKLSSTKGNGGNNGKVGTDSPMSLFQLENTLTCVMCNQSGFQSSEEFGTHVALCDGGGNASMLELEDRVKSVDVSSVMGFDVAAAAAASSSVPEGKEDTGGNADDVDGFLDIIVEDDMEDYDVDEEEELGIIGGKWDGESPFGTDTAAPSNKITLTDQEILTRYQSMYDDEATNYDLTLDLVRYVTKSSYGDGAILVFFSGWADISEFSMLLESTPPFNDRSQFVVYPLHSGIPSKEQRQVFIKPPNGMRKIILATNIAETSLTIEDVAFVIDTGRAKEKSYDPHMKTSTLQEAWISQASAKQRKGRAGRCKAGVCFHLFSRRRHGFMRPFVESELIRTPLEEICLQCKRLQLAPGGPDEPNGIPAFLSKAMTPPHSKSVTNALELLVELGAMDEETNELSDLGVCLSALSLEPRVGKMVIMSYLIGCAKASSSMAVAMSHKSPFAIPPPSMRKASDMAKIKLSDRSESDQITSLNVLRNRDILSKRGVGAISGWCRQNFLNFSSLNMISDLRKNVSRELENLGFPPCSQSGYHNRNGDFNPAFLQASICAGLYPNVAYRRQGDVNFSTMTNRKAKFHMSSINAVKSQPLSTKCQVAENQVEFVVFGELVKGKAMFTMENTTHLVSPLPLLLLCGQLHTRPIHFAAAESTSAATNKPPTKKAILSLDDWLVFLCEPETASALVVLRQRLDSAFSRITSDPNNFTDLPAVEKDAVETLSLVLNSSHNAAPMR